MKELKKSDIIIFPYPQPGARAFIAREVFVNYEDQIVVVSIPPLKCDVGRVNKYLIEVPFNRVFVYESKRARRIHLDNSIIMDWGNNLVGFTDNPKPDQRN